MAGGSRRGGTVRWSEADFHRGMGGIKCSILNLVDESRSSSLDVVLTSSSVAAYLGGSGSRMVVAVVVIRSCGCET